MSQMSPASVTPTNIFARLETLKKWQLEQQQRLLEQQSQQSEFLSNEHRRMYEALGLQSDVSETDPTSPIRIEPTRFHSNLQQHDDYSSEEEVYAINYDSSDPSNKNPENLDEMPIKSPRKDFVELLEEKLKIDNSKPAANNSMKPKRAFLKKGTGLNRFRMTVDDLAHKKPKSKPKLSLCKSRVSTRQESATAQKSNQKTETATKSNNRKKDNNNQMITKKSDQNHRNQPKKFEPLESVNIKDYEIRLPRKGMTQFKNSELQNKSTFTSSEQRHSESHESEFTYQECATMPSRSEITQFNYDDAERNRIPQMKTVDKVNDSDPRATWCTSANSTALNGIPSDYHALLAELIEVRKRDPAIFDSPMINKSSEDGQQMFERELYDELKIFELLEQKASNSSFCSTSSLVTRLMEHSVKSTPKKSLQFNLHPDHNQQVEEPITMVEHSVQTTPRKSVSFADRQPEYATVYEDERENISDSDESDSSDTASESSVNSDDLINGASTQTLQPKVVQSEQIWRQKLHHTPQPVMRDAATNTDAPPINSELLKTRLEQLETELDTFRTENARVAKLKSELETETRSFDKRKRQLEKEVEEQKRQMEVQLEAEKVKLAKDRLVYERYAREVKEGKTARQKEREEINSLRSKINTIEEEIKLKESRWGATQARIRSQLRNLEKENATLRAENNELRSKNGKLEATNKQLLSRKPSDTKVLHEINKNLTKLTQEAKNKTPPPPETKERRKSSGSGHGNKLNRSRSANRTVEQKTVTILDDEDNNKENNRNSFNSTNNDSKSTTDRSFESVEREYERMFGMSEEAKNEHAVLPAAEASSCSNTSGRREETVLEDGSICTTYPNGNVRTVSADGQMIVMRYHNGDVKETCRETGTVRYLYADAQTWHTTFPDGLELLEFSNGQTEKRFANGASEIHFPNGCRRCISPNGTEEVSFPDGTLLLTKPSDGEKILTLPNGQREIHTREHKRREYPDGTIKILYPDGVQETRYANGRIRLKDKDGNLIMDSAGV